MKKLSKIIFQVTTKCNETCNHCFAPKGMGDLTLEEHMKISQNIVSLSIHRINWTGGECLLVPHIKLLLEFTKKNNIINVINTNGIVVPQKIRYLKYYVDSINLSANSFNSETIKRMNKNPEHKRIILDAINEIKKCDIPLRINTVITRQNKDDLDEMGEVFEMIDISDWLFMEYSPLRNTAKNAILTHDEFEAIVRTQIINHPRIHINSRIRDNYEQDLDLIMADGRFTRTRNSQDITIGNPLVREITQDEFLQSL